MLASRIGSSQVNAGSAYLMDAVAAAYIGFSLGGSNKPNAVGTFVGAALIGVCQERAGDVLGSLLRNGHREGRRARAGVGPDVRETTIMRNYDSYFLMSAADAADYVLRNLSFFRPSDELEASEIGTGNLNYIFRVRDRRSDRSLVIKQAGGTARISDQFKVSTDRSRIEYKAPA